MDEKKTVRQISLYSYSYCAFWIRTHSEQKYITHLIFADFSPNDYNSDLPARFWSLDFLLGLSNGLKTFFYDIKLLRLISEQLIN
jgi:hypothetical protein